MKTADLKIDLHRLIDQIEDSRLLQAVYIILSRETAEGKVSDWNKLSEVEKQAITEGLDDIENGRVSTHEEVMARIRSKYKI